MDSKQQPIETGASGHASVAGLSASRRKLLRSGAAVAPVVMTFASKPAFATANCMSASATVSANASGRAVQKFFCEAAGPSTWLAGTGWPNSVPTGTKFQSFFGTSPAYKTIDDTNPSMHRVFTKPCSTGFSAEDQTLARLALSLYLSHKAGRAMPAQVFGPDVEATIKSLWNGTYIAAGSSQAMSKSARVSWMSQLFRTL